MMSHVNFFLSLFTFYIHPHLNLWKKMSFLCFVVDFKFHLKLTSFHDWLFMKGSQSEKNVDYKIFDSSFNRHWQKKYEWFVGVQDCHPPHSITLINLWQWKSSVYSSFGIRFLSKVSMGQKYIPKHLFRYCVKTWSFQEKTGFNSSLVHQFISVFFQKQTSGQFSFIEKKKKSFCKIQVPFNFFDFE